MRHVSPAPTLRVACPWQRTPFSPRPSPPLERVGPASPHRRHSGELHQLPASHCYAEVRAIVRETSRRVGMNRIHPRPGMDGGWREVRCRGHRTVSREGVISVPAWSARAGGSSWCGGWMRFTPTRGVSGAEGSIGWDGAQVHALHRTEGPRHIADRVSHSACGTTSDENRIPQPKPDLATESVFESIFMRAASYTGNVCGVHRPGSHVPRA